jgi:hypothetical protein
VPEMGDEACRMTQALQAARAGLPPRRAFPQSASWVCARRGFRAACNDILSSHLVQNTWLCSLSHIIHTITGIFSYR